MAVKAMAGTQRVEQHCQPPEKKRSASPLLVGLTVMLSGLSSPASAFSDAEIGAFLQRRYSCPVLAAQNTVNGTLRAAEGMAQAFLFGAEGCRGLPFTGSSFGVVVSRAAGMTLLVPQPAPTGVSAVALRDGYVVATSLDYAPGDPRCCPSRQVSQRWVASGNALTRAP